MLVVKVEIWPGGDEDRARTLGTLALANVSNLADVSDYVVTIDDDRGTHTDTLVTGHPRRDGFWVLLGRALAGDTPPVPGQLRDLAGRMREHVRTQVRPGERVHRFVPGSFLDRVAD